MTVKETIEELNQFFQIQKESKELHQNINRIYTLINSHSKDTTLQEVLEGIAGQLKENT